MMTLSVASLNNGHVDVLCMFLRHRSSYELLNAENATVSYSLGEPLEREPFCCLCGCIIITDDVFGMSDLP